MTLQGLTAHYLVHDKKPVGPGSNVLVHAAAGGMGLLLCGWLKRLGARVIGTVSTREKASHARAAGADETILYGEEDRILPDVAQTMARVKDALPHAEVRSIPGCGHFLQEDRPQEVADAMAAFFGPG